MKNKRGWHPCDWFIAMLLGFTWSVTVMTIAETVTQYHERTIEGETVHAEHGIDRYCRLNNYAVANIIDERTFSAKVVDLGYEFCYKNYQFVTE